jgi:hypothetical protein
MKSVASLLLLAATLHAAALRGTVVEAQTGKALARALVAVHPVVGTAGATKAVRTNNYGAFEFLGIAEGAYIVSVARKGFAPIQYGQKQWKGAGTPVVLQDREATLLRIAVPRYGAITGRISDEADVGLVELEVIAYRNTRPPQMVAKAATDDRGVFRIFGLEPGSYLVRTAPKQYDEDGGGYLPTFHKETPIVDGAYAVDVALDRDTPDVNIRPAPGRLYSIGGRVLAPGTLRQQWSVWLISDMGIETKNTDEFGRFLFNAASPGKYELMTQSPLGAAWLPIEIDRDRTESRLQVYPPPTVEFAFEDGRGGTVDTATLQLLARRKELWGPSEAQYLQLTGNRVQLSPGRWEFALAPNPVYYTRGWTEAVVTFNGQGSLVRFAVSPNPGAVHGTVTDAAGTASAGAPVYLERAGEVRSTRTDVRGAFSFGGLPPGEYRISSTFEAQTAGAGQTVKVEEAQDVAVGLRLGPG